MCGIVAGVTERNIVPILLEGLKRLEYRGYDSAGVAVIDDSGLNRCRATGKVASLVDKVRQQQLQGRVGIAHTRWATHGAPSEKNAHPHTSSNQIAVVHNGIIENYLDIRQQLQKAGYEFSSDTDSEAVAHLIHQAFLHNGGDLRLAVQSAVSQLNGAFALAVFAVDCPDRIIATRHGSPMVVGLGIGEYFVASDSFALLPVTRRFVYLQEDDTVEITGDGWQIYDAQQQPVERECVENEQSADLIGKGRYKHFMQKEMFEQPEVVAQTLQGRIHHGMLQTQAFAPALLEALAKVQQIDIIACGTSYHAGLVIKSHLERAGIRTNVEYASEYLYREVAVMPKTLFVSISQSGETADTLAALEKAKKLAYFDYLAVCNVPDSALVRTSSHVLLTRAGREIGVASTKAFVTQLVALHILCLFIQQAQGKTINPALVQAFERLPSFCERMLALDERIAEVAKSLHDKSACLFLGRGEGFAIAAEGALKLKELSYIQAQAYPSGELKHGPLALVDDSMPVIALITHDHLAEKMMSNLQEVQARGGKIILFADSRVDKRALNAQTQLIDLGELEEITASIAAVIPLQLFAYHVALLKGTDVDQPRNLAKSVTVE